MRTLLVFAAILSVFILMPFGLVAAGPDYTLLGMDQDQDLGQTVFRNEDGTVRKLVNTNSLPRVGTPEEIANLFLTENAAIIFGRPASSQSGAPTFGTVELVDIRTRSSLSGYHVWKQAVVDGVPVFGGYIIVHLTHDGIVLFATNEVGSMVFDLYNLAPTVNDNSAMNSAMSLVGGDGVLRIPQQSELMVLRTHSGDRLAWRTLTATYNPYGDWEIFIDAITGVEISRQDRLVCIKPGEKPQSISPPVDQPTSPIRPSGAAKVSGSGMVLIANPLNGHPERYGWRDGDPGPDTVLDPVALNNLDGTGFLTGLWADVFNSDVPRTNEPTLIFNYSSLVLNGHFHEVNVYYHIDTFQDYIQNTLGIANARSRVTTCYAHQGEDDNSDFSPAQDRIRFGDGGVDDSEDGEVVLHEYGHAIHEDIVPGFVYAAETGAISEGFGDYLAASFGNNPLVAEWDATSYNPGPPPNLRRTDTTKHYPEDIIGEVHADGEIIAGAWYDLRVLVGQTIADQLIIEAMFYTGPSATFQDYADGVVAADQAIYGGSHLGYIYQAFGGRGIGPTYLLQFDHVALGDTEDQIGPYPVVATITHTSPITAPGAVKLFYRYGGVGVYTEVIMGAPPASSTYTANLPGPGAIALVEYYLTVIDDAGIAAALPSTAPAVVMSFQVGPDAQPPMIVHTPIGDKPLMAWPASVDALITDNGSIASATVSYSLNGVPQADLTMAPLGGDAYSVFFPEPVAGLAIGDIFDYAITAVDVSSLVNTTVVGPYSFMIIDALGTVLILNDDTVVASVPKYDRNKKIVQPHVRDPLSKGAAANQMSTILTTAGWVVTLEQAAISDPATWSSYSFIISSSGANTATLLSLGYQAAVEAYVAAGGKLISEGGEVAYNAISYPGYPTYAANVLHGNTWDSDNAGPLGVIPGMEIHPIMSIPNAVAGSLAINYTGYGDQDSYGINPDAYAVMSPASGPNNAGIMVFDNNPNPASAQIVHYAFNFAALADTNEAAKLLENTALFLIAPEVGGTASISGEVTVGYGWDNTGVLVEANPGGFSAITGQDGTYTLSNLYGNTYTVTATLTGYASIPLNVVVGPGQNITGIDFGLGVVSEYSFCDQPGTAIPDNNPVGITQQLVVSNGQIIGDINCSVNITHTWKGDLIVELTSPLGTTVRLHNLSGSSANDIIANYDLDTIPDGPGVMNDFNGEPPIGIWTLSISDNAAGDIGTLNEWCLNVQVSDLVVSNDMPELEISQLDHEPLLKWSSDAISTGRYNIYRRVAGDAAVRLTETPISGRSGQVQYLDKTADFDEGTELFYSLGLVLDDVEVAVGSEIKYVVSSRLPTKFALRDNYPNPFNPITSIEFDLPRAGRVKLMVVDVSGRIVRMLVDKTLTRATHVYKWDGTDSQGRRVASGTYYYRVQTPSRIATGKMLLVK